MSDLQRAVEKVWMDNPCFATVGSAELFYEYILPIITAALAQKDADILQLQKSLNYINDSCLRAEAERDQLREQLHFQNIELLQRDAGYIKLQKRVAELEAALSTTPLPVKLAAAKIEGLRVAMGLWREDLRGFKELVNAEIDDLLAMRKES